MRIRSVVGWVPLVLYLSCLIILCNKKEKSTSWIIGNDTLSLEQIRILDPEGSNDSMKIRNTGMRLLWGGGLTRSNVHDTLVTIFSERLLLLSGKEWNQNAAGILLNAAQQVAACDDSTGICHGVERKADSLCTVLNSYIQKFALPCSTIQWCDTTVRNMRETRIVMLKRLFGVSHETAGLCYEFVFKSKQASAPSSDLSSRSLIAGLVASNDSAQTTGSRQKVPRAATGPGRRDPSINILRFRDEKSIRDSIDRHIPNIRQLYKKVLKKDAALAGTIIISFQVASQGAVINANIKSASINNRLFLDPFLAYIKTIRFKPVPEGSGTMRFDFPFEFNTDM